MKIEASDSALFASLKSSVRSELENYRYEHLSSSVGVAWGNDQVQAALKDMQDSLIEPYWTEVVLGDTPEQWELSTPLIRKCIAVADNRHGYLLLWDPSEETFMLGHNTNGPMSSFGIRGDAVGCFLAI